MHSKQWHYSLHRDFQNCYSTQKSPTGFFSSNSTRVPIHHTPPTCVHMHPENSPSRIQFYMQKTKSSSSTTTTYRGQRDLHSRFQKRNSMHRRQGDLEIHPCVLQDIPDIPVFLVFPDLPVIPDTPETFQTFQSFMTFQPFQAILQVPVFPGNPPHSSILRLECIFYIFYKFYSSIGFHRKLHQVPVEQLQTLQTFILQRKGDVVISVKRASVKMSR